MANPQKKDISRTFYCGKISFLLFHETSLFE